MADVTLDELCRRLRRLEDLEAIKRLKARYLNACDSQDAEAVKSCFAQGEVLIDMGHVGVFRSREEFVDFYRAAGCQPFVLDMHHGANAEIELVDEHHAKALWALEYRNINLSARTLTVLSVVYHDEYVRIGEQWKISRSQCEFKTAMQCSYASGTLVTRVVGRSLNEPAAAGPEQRDG